MNCKTNTMKIKKNYLIFFSQEGSYEFIFISQTMESKKYRVIYLWKRWSPVTFNENVFIFIYTCWTLLVLSLIIFYLNSTYF